MCFLSSSTSDTTGSPKLPGHPTCIKSTCIKTDTSVSVSQPTPLPSYLPSPDYMVHGGKDFYLFCSTGVYPGPRKVLACSEYQRLCSEWMRKWMTAGINGSVNQSVQLLSSVQLFMTLWTAAFQASLSITNSRSLLKLMSIKSVIPSNHLILCRPILFLTSIVPSIRVFSSESVLCIMWPKYWSFSFSISSSNEYSQLISFRIDWFDLVAIQGTFQHLFQHHSSKASIFQHSAFFMVQLSHPLGFPGGSEVKASASNAGDPGLIPGSGRSPGEGNGNPLQYSCLENPMDRGAWQATVHGVTKSQAQLSDFTSLHIYTWLLEKP